MVQVIWSRLVCMDWMSHAYGGCVPKHTPLAMILSSYMSGSFFPRNNCYHHLTDTSCRLCSGFQFLFSNQKKRFPEFIYKTFQSSCAILWVITHKSLQTFTAVIFQVDVFWVVTPCSVLVGYLSFGGLCCLYLQSEVAWMWENFLRYHARWNCLSPWCITGTVIWKTRTIFVCACCR